MSKPQGPCAKCQGDMTVSRLDAFSGEERGVKVTLQGMPAAVCGQGHKRFVYPLLAGLLMDLAMETDHYKAVPSAVKKGLFTKRYLCPGCAMELPLTPTGHQSQELQAEFKHVDPFKIVIEFPVYRCSGCGKESLHSSEETGKLAASAMGHAFRGTDIHPT